MKKLLLLSLLLILNSCLAVRAPSVKIGMTVDDFIKAAALSESAGFDGVELHAAHGYILAQFLSPEINQREDAYGQSLNNRCRLLYEIVDGIRKECNNKTVNVPGPGFIM